MHALTEWLLLDRLDEGMKILFISHLQSKAAIIENYCP
jgi:hypothetical protein